MQAYFRFNVFGFPSTLHFPFMEQQLDEMIDVVCGLVGRPAHFWVTSLGAICRWSVELRLEQARTFLVFSTLRKARCQPRSTLAAQV
jgi:hypothetical protein